MLRILIILALALCSGIPVSGDEPAVLKIGMIGLDTSHCLAFARLLNMPDDAQHVPGCRITLVYPKGSPDIESSVSRVPGYTAEIRKLGVEVIDDLDAMIAQVDAVLLETNDGRPHLEQVIFVLKAGKRVFIDKPIAGSLVDAIVIFRLAEHYQVPLFSSSSLRFSAAAQAVRNGSIGEVTGCDAFSPCSLEPTHPDLFWYGMVFTGARPCLPSWAPAVNRSCGRRPRTLIRSPVSGRAGGLERFAESDRAGVDMVAPRSARRALPRLAPTTVTGRWSWSS